MGMFSLFNQAQDTVTLVLHVDVGQGNCRGALLRHGQRPEMIFSSLGSEKVAHISHAKTLAITLSSLTENLAEISAFITAQKKEGISHKIGKIYVILSAPYYLSHTASLKYRDDQGFLVTPKLISDLVEGYKKTERDYEGHADARLGGSPLPIGEKIIHAKINGYHTANPYGKQAKVLDVDIFRTEVDSDIVNGVSREIKKIFQTPITFEPLSLAVYIALRNHIHFDPHFLFVVIGSEVTEVSLVKSFALVETVSFPFGRHSLMRHLARDIETSGELVSQDISLFNQGAMHDSQKTKFSIALSSGGKEWFSFFEKALVDLSGESAVPQSVYLVSDLDVQPLFKKFIETDSYASQSLVPNGFNVTPIDPELAKALMNFGPQASCDTILCLEGLYALSPKLLLSNA